jgi:two-component system, chemotaxis family, protein-glutamate methylesterase/glutaminase
MTIRVLVVDDSIVFRTAISDALKGDTDVTVIGTAANGKLALQKIALDLPDAVVLDVEMPVMDGLTTVSEIRKIWPKLTIIMCSSLTTQGARVTIEALERGANDFVSKPVTNSIEESLAHFRSALLPLIKGNARHLLNASSSARPAITPIKDQQELPGLGSPRISLQHRIDLVVLGVSTGGPNALAEIIPALPANLPVPLLIVQHMPALFTKILAERLAHISSLPVAEASTPGITLQPGHIWIAPGGRHLTVNKSGNQFALDLNDEVPERSCRPSINVLFRSAAAACGLNTLGVILTGMGDDGTDGCKAIRQAGGQIIVQDRESSVVWGMPGNVVKAGVADKTIPLSGIASEIINRLHLDRPQFISSIRTA